MIKRNATNAASAAAALCLCAGAPAVLAQATIAELAPERSVVVAGVDDFAAAEAAFESAGLMDLWNEPAIQEWFSEVSEEGLAEMTESLNSLGFTMEDLSTPEGPAGFALFLEGGEDDARDTRYHFLTVADFADNAQTMHDLFVAGLEEEAEDDMIALAEDEYAGVTIWTIEQLDAMDMDDDEDWEDDWGNDWDQGGVEPWTTLYYANPGNSLVVASSLAEIEHAIDRIAGGEQLETVEALTGWGVTKSMLGDGAHAYAVSITEPWFDLTEGIEEAQFNDGMTDMPPVTQILGASGLGRVQGMGVAINFDANGHIAEQQFAVAVPELTGLMSLIPAEPTPFTAPNFVSADATSFTMLQVDWGQLLPTIREIAMQLPPEVQQQILPGLGMAQGFVGPLFASLGREIYLVSEIQRPFSSTSNQTLVALNVTDENAVRQTFDQLLMMAPLPLETREFQGGTIWSMPEDMGGGMMGGPMGGSMPSLALGAGHLFIGSTEGIENALRTAGDAGAARLAGDARFLAAAEGVAGNGLSYSWTDFKATLEYGQWFIDNQDEIQRQQLRDFGMTDEEIDEQMQWMGGGNPALENLPDLAVLGKYIGDSVTTFDVTPQGIVGTTRVLKAE